MNLSIMDINYFVPETMIKLKDSYEDYGLSESQMRVYTRFYGIDDIPVSTLSMKEMMVNVSKSIISKSSREKVRYVIAPRTAPVISPFGVSLVREVAEQLELTNAIPLVIGMNKCVSTLRAFEVAKKLLMSCLDDECALIITGESVFTEQNRVLPNITVTGDAASAALVKFENSTNNTLISIATEIYGKYAKGVWMSMEEVSEFGNIFNESMAEVILKSLDEANLNLSDIKIIFPHNVNFPCWRGFSKYIGISVDKIFLRNIPKTSHCFNSDILINLSIAMENKLLKKGDYYIMATVGVGAMFGAAVFQY